MTLLSEAVRRPVMSTSEARTLGFVSGFLIDPATAQIVALRLGKAPGPGDTVRWEDLTAFGDDVVTVPSESVISAAEGRAADLAGSDAYLIGKRLLTDTGVHLGTVDDVDFDTGTGAVRYLLIGEDRVAGSRLVGCGPYAVVVHDD